MVLDSLKEITGKHFPFTKGDTRDSNKLEKILKEYRIDAVIHFSGLKAVSESIQKPIDYYDNNIGSTISLLKAMRNAEVKTLVFSSSATVYGDPQYLPIDEEHPTGSSNPYGRSKLHIEEILADVVKADPTWRIACLRYFNPVGAHDSGLIGEDPKDIPNNLMPMIAQVASGKLTKLSVFGTDYNTPDGSGVRDYIHVLDLAKGHNSALTYLENHAGWHAFNLGTGTGYSVLEMISVFEEVSGQVVPFGIAPRRAGDVASCYANADKAKKQLGWQAKRTLEEMCRSTWNFQRTSKK